MRIKIEADLYFIKSLILTIKKEYFKDKDNKRFDTSTNLLYNGLKQEQIYKRIKELQ